MKKHDTEGEFRLAARPFNQRMFTPAHMEAVQKKVRIRQVPPRKSLSVGMFSIAAVALLVILLVHYNPDVVRGTITDKLTPAEPPQVEIQENMILVDYRLDGMARLNLDYISDEHGRLVIDPAFYEKKKPQRGDVVYYGRPNFDYKSYNPELNPPETNIARIIALPGESIEISDGQVYINGKRLNTFYGKASMWGQDEKEYFENIKKPGTGVCLAECTKGMKQYFHMNMKKVQVPAGSIFVMGDTWARSIDSQIFGPLPVDLIKGKVLGYEGKPSPSPTFQSGSYQMQGVKGKLGIIAAAFKVGVSNKYMWHFWGTKETLTGSFKVEALRVATGQKKQTLMTNGSMVWEYGAGPVVSSLNGADASLPSMMMLEDPGLWRLDAFISGRFFGSIFVEVK
jgi:signal peptidase I